MRDIATGVGQRWAAGHDSTAERAVDAMAGAGHGDKLSRERQRRHMVAGSIGYGRACHSGWVRSGTDEAVGGARHNQLLATGGLLLFI
jgi:hypothetical protein